MKTAVAIALMAIGFVAGIAIGFMSPLMREHNRLPKASHAAFRTEDELVQLEKQWAQAGPKGDVGFFDRIAADDYVIVDVDGSVRNKRDEVANFRKEKQTSQSVDDMRVRIYGETAVVTGRFEITGTWNGQPNNFSGRFTDVWVIRDGRWQVVSTQNTSLSDGRAQPEPSPK
jgi:ketosteroid isomerase-like protein